MFVVAQSLQSYRTGETKNTFFPYFLTGTADVDGDRAVMKKERPKFAQGLKSALKWCKLFLIIR